MQKDAFKPQGRELNVMGSFNPLATQGNMPARMMPSVGAPPARPQGPAPMAMEPVGRGAAIGGAKPVPRGAQEVRLAGGAPPPLDGGAVNRGASFQPVAMAPESEAPAPAPSMAQAPRPFLQRQPSGGESVVRITAHFRMGDAEYVAPYDVTNLPPGAQLVNVSHELIS